MNSLFDEFKAICARLNEAGIIPTLMGSLGLEYVSGADWNPSDIDIHVPGDPRGWQAPDALRIRSWDKIVAIMSELGYQLVDIHEHEFRKNGISAEYGSIDSLYDFAGISESDIPLVELNDIRFRVPSLKQFLSIYEASSKDSYRNDKNNNKDFKKIDWLKKHILGTDITAHTPEYTELWFKQQMLADEATMSYNHAYGGTISFPEEKWQAWYDRWIVHPEGKRYYRYLKNEDGAFIGEMAYHYDEEIDGYIADVIIFAPYRGKGYGSEALELLCAAARENGISELYDDIATDNPAIELFRRHGFVEECRTKDTILLKKTLK